MVAEDAKIELVGGPRDGEFFPDFGPWFRELARQEPCLLACAEPSIAHLDFPVIDDGPRVLEYEKRIDAGDGLPRYLFRGG